MLDRKRAILDAGDAWWTPMTRMGALGEYGMVYTMTDITETSPLLYGATHVRAQQTYWKESSGRVVVQGIYPYNSQDFTPRREP